MVFDGLWNQQNRDAEQAETADGRQYGVGVGSNHLASRELLLVVVDHVSRLIDPSLAGVGIACYGAPCFSR